MNNLIFITDIKDPQNESRSDPYKYGVKSWENWAEKNNTDIFKLNESFVKQGKPTWNKTFAIDILKERNIDFNQIAVVDSDTIIHPDCPNFFDLTENKFCGVVNEGSFDWVIRSIENYSKYMFDGFSFPYWRYLNSGFLIFNKDHENFYKEVSSFYINNVDEINRFQSTFHSGTDQPIINFFLNMRDIDLKILPYYYNMQDMARKEILNEDLTFTKIGWIYHYNAIPNNKNSEKTFYWMKKTYEHFYGNLI